VREALEFSALLRQPRTISRRDKLAYVEVIIDLLEMHDIENCLIGLPGSAGLSVEQRKRLTIGVELVAKPSILAFLDEPTSGLDGQAAFNIIRFLKKLAAAGQAILVTIHQPSSQLFYDFDTLLSYQTEVAGPPTLERSSIKLPLSKLTLIARTLPVRLIRIQPNT
jgi:ATP-binding cassette, subfamily G (WHITE), member 2, SNQ2